MRYCKESGINCEKGSALKFVILLFVLLDCDCCE
jgi:hypothetical protein